MIKKTDLNSVREITDMMCTLKIVFALTLAVFANANPHPVKLEDTDADLFRKFIECARIALVNGIPEIGLPSHDPLIITHDLKQEFNAIGILTGFTSLENMVMRDIPNWEVRQFDELSADDNGIDIFNYTIYWRDIIFTGEWKYSLNIFGQQFDNEGSFTIELDHVNFYGILNYTKSGPTRSETINDLGLHVSTEEVKADITNVGDISDIIDELDRELVDEINTFDYTEVSEALKNRLITDWILKPERLDAIIANCRK